MKKRVVLAVGIVVAVLAGAGVFIAGILSSIADNERRSKSTECPSRLHQIDIALVNYCYPPMTNYPSDLSLLSHDVSPEMFVCPLGTNHPGAITNVMEWMDYIYVVGQNLQTPAGVPILICPPEQHNGESGRVLQSDHSIKWMRKADIDQLISNIMNPTSGYTVVVSKRLTEQSKGKYTSKP